MSSIDPTSRLLTYLRQQTGEWRRQLPAGSVKAAGRPAPGAAADRMKLAAHAIAAIDPHDPDCARKAFRVYLEAVLAREFGAYSSAPGFGGLVDRVHATMEADGELKQAMQEAGALLLRGKASPA
jgi:hypothetical protein